MPAKTGDFLLLNYTLKVKESGETVDTTFDNIAKDAHIHRQDTTYGPRFIILGEGWIPKGLEDSLIGLDAGKQTTVELSPEKGYGARDPAKMRLVPLRRFREKEIEPAPGAQVELDGRPAVVRAVGAGRVQVDYNHPLAGRTLIYDVSIEKVLDSDDEKTLNIISRRIPEVTKDKFLVNRAGGDVTIEVPEEAFYLSGLQVAKKAITTDIQKYLPEAGSISFIETFKKPEAKAETEPEIAPVAAASEQPALKEEKPEPIPEKREPAQEAVPKQRKRASAKRVATRPSRRRSMQGSESQR